MATVYIYSADAVAPLQKGAFIEAIRNAFAKPDLTAHEIACVFIHDLPVTRAAIWAMALRTDHFAHYMPKAPLAKTAGEKPAYDDAVDRMREHWSPDPRRSRRRRYSR